METESLISNDLLTGFCRRWKVVELAIFGSAIRADFDEESDFDFLIAFAPEADWGLLDHVAMRIELAEITGRNIDLITRHALENSENWIRRDEILSTAIVLYQDGATVYDSG